MNLNQKKRLQKRSHLYISLINLNRFFLTLPRTYLKIHFDNPIVWSLHKNVNIFIDFCKLSSLCQSASIFNLVFFNFNLLLLAFIQPSSVEIEMEACTFLVNNHLKYQLMSIAIGSIAMNESSIPDL